MLCRALLDLGFRSHYGMITDFSLDNLRKGAAVREPVHPCFDDAQEDLSHYHLGKDDSIHHMLEGGNGFSSLEHYTLTYAQKALFDIGQVSERRDLRSMTVWSRDLGQALSDRKRGRVDG